MKKKPALEDLQKSDSAFKEAQGNKKRTAVLYWFDPATFDKTIASGCQESADFLLNHVGEKELFGHPDRFFFPICFLYRHSYELMLKESIQCCIALNLISKDQYKNIKYSHKLNRLWELLKPAIISLNHNGSQEILAAAENIIMEFNSYDPSGYSFRYTYNKNDALSIPDRYRQRSIDIDNFQIVAKKLFDFLEGIYYQLLNCLDHCGEQ